MNYFKIAIAVVALVMTVSCKKAPVTQQETPAQAYPLLTVSRSTVELQTVYPAVLKGQEDIDIKPRIDGFIEAVYVDEGSVVRRGQSLFRINSPVSVQQLEVAQANYSNALTDLERLRPLAEKGIISEVRIKTTENLVATAKASLDQAKANIGFATVTSPVDGVVGQIPFRLGSLVNNSSVLTTVANTSRVVAYFSLNEKELIPFMRQWQGSSQAEKIKNIPAVKLILSDGSEYEETGRIETIAGVVDAVTGSVNFRASFGNGQGLLRSGTSGRIAIPQQLENVVVIPQRCTISQQDKVTVYKIEGDVATQKVVKVRATPDGQSYVVLEGLTEGEQIIAEGVSLVRNGQKVKI